MNLGHLSDSMIANFASE